MTRVRRRCRIVCVLALLLLTVASIPAYAEVTLIGAPAVRLAASSHSGTARMRLRSTTDERLLLTLGPLVDVTTKEVLPADVELLEASSKSATFDAKANQIYDVTVQVSKVLFEGEAQAPILNRGTKIGDLQIVRAPFAVNVATTAPIPFREDASNVIPIRNDSRDVHAFRWMMQIGPDKYCGNPKGCDDVASWARVSLQPKETAHLEVNPPTAWFRSPSMAWFTWVGVLRRDVRDATLWLALPGEVPKRALTLKADLSGYFYPGDIVWIVVMLTLGASTSLLVRYWVPNMQRKRDLKDQIRRVRGKIDGLSTEIDSTLRTLVRVQLNLVDSLRKSTKTFFPEYTTVAALCAQGIALLERRVGMIEEIDSTLEQASSKWERCPPPSQVDEVEELLRNAADVLRKPEPQEADFLHARKLIDLARGINERMGTDDEDFGKRLAARLDRMRAEMKALRATKPNDAYLALEAALPGIFALVGAAQDGGAGPQGGEANAPNGGAARPSDPIPSALHSQVDYDLSALTIARDFIWLYEGSADEDFRKTLREVVQTRVLRHLAHKSWNELRLAGLALKEFRENNSDVQVLAAIEAGNEQMFVEQEPRGLLVEPGLVTIRPRQLVQFRACFRRTELNWSAARENFSCVWDFGDGHKDERGWVASHFFHYERSSWWSRLWRWGQRTFTAGNNHAERGGWKRRAVTVEFRDRSGKPVHTELAPLQVEIRPDPSEDRRTRLVGEAVGLAVSIAVPLVALIAGAQEQLAQNPAGAAMTVFLLGYGSESIISVFKQRATPASS